MKKNNAIILCGINIFFILVTSLEFLYLYIIEDSYNLFFRKFLDFQFLFVLGYSIICGTILISFFQPYNIFLGTFFIFLGGRFFLDLFNLRDVMLMDRFINFSLKGIEEVELFKIMIFSILFINLGFLISNILNNKEIKKYIISRKILKIRKIYKILYEIFFCLETYKKFLLFNFVKKNTYLGLYKKQINYPFFTKGSGTFLEITYMLFLLTRPKKKEFIIISIQYIFIGFFEALSGSRGKFIIRILIVLTYYFCEYNQNKKKNNYLFVSATLSFIVIFSQYINQTRAGLKFNLAGVYFSFISQQSTSINVLGTLIKYKEELFFKVKNVIFSPFFYRVGINNIENSITGTLTYRLSHFLSPDLYFSGQGLGGSFLGDIYNLSIILKILLLIFLGFMIHTAFINRNKNIFLSGVYFIALNHIYYMSRGNYFIGIWQLPNLIVILIHYFIVKNLKGKR